MIQISHLLLEVSYDVINIDLCLTDTLRVVLNELQHDLDHVVFIVLLIIVMQSLQFYEALKVVVPLLKVYHLQKIVLH